MRYRISKLLSLFGLALGLLGWIIFLAGSVYAAMALSTECPPGGLFSPRETMQMTVSDVAWWFTLVGLPLAFVAIGVNFRSRLGWMGILANSAFWILMWGWLYGDVATCQ